MSKDNKQRYKGFKSQILTNASEQFVDDVSVTSLKAETPDTNLTTDVDVVTSKRMDIVYSLFSHGSHVTNPAVKYLYLVFEKKSKPHLTLKRIFDATPSDAKHDLYLVAEKKFIPDNLYYMKLKLLDFAKHIPVVSVTSLAHNAAFQFFFDVDYVNSSKGAHLQIKFPIYLFDGNTIGLVFEEATPPILPKLIRDFAKDHKKDQKCSTEKLYTACSGFMEEFNKKTTREQCSTKIKKNTTLFSISGNAHEGAGCHSDMSTVVLDDTNETTRQAQISLLKQYQCTDAAGFSTNYTMLTAGKSGISTSEYLVTEDIMLNQPSKAKEQKNPNVFHLVVHRGHPLNDEFAINIAEFFHAIKFYDEAETFSFIVWSSLDNFEIDADYCCEINNKTNATFVIVPSIKANTVSTRCLDYYCITDKDRLKRPIQLVNFKYPLYDISE